MLGSSDWDPGGCCPPPTFRCIGAWLQGWRTGGGAAGGRFDEDRDGENGKVQEKSGSLRKHLVEWVWVVEERET